MPCDSFRFNSRKSISRCKPFTLIQCLKFDMRIWKKQLERYSRWAYRQFSMLSDISAVNSIKYAFFSNRLCCKFEMLLIGFWLDENQWESKIQTFFEVENIQLDWYVTSNSIVDEPYNEWLLPLAKNTTKWCKTQTIDQIW